MRRVFDLFLFFEELDLLELRLETLDKVVDVFVLAEANRTHSGKEKPYHWLSAQWESRFSPYRDKVRYVQVELPPHPGAGTCAPWCAASESRELLYRFENEHLQRAHLMRGLTDVGANDMILLSDLDEIPSPEAVGNGLLGAYEMPTYYYRLNWKTPDRIVGTVGFTPGNVDGKTLQWVREHRYYVSPVIREAGWHFSYMGDAERIQRKLEAAGHAEVDKAHVKAGLAQAILERRDLLGRWPSAFTVEPVASMPPPVAKNPSLWETRGLLVTES